MALNQLLPAVKTMIPGIGPLSAGGINSDDIFDKVFRSLDDTHSDLSFFSIAFQNSSDENSSKCINMPLDNNLEYTTCVYEDSDDKKSTVRMFVKNLNINGSGYTFKISPKFIFMFKENDFACAGRYRNGNKVSCMNIQDIPVFHAGLRAFLGFNEVFNLYMVLPGGKAVCEKADIFTYDKESEMVTFDYF